ncbi:MAG: sugar ABC transporter permease [Opitutaceae bacterium]|nr:sugar ABC transporter permease [Cephaloticoccus sp.]MCP5529764.1 sugar ABC transporter permease [Opitutaceae bacterium]
MKLKASLRKLPIALLFLLPNILGFIAFILVPLVMSFGMAFTDWDFLRHNIFRDEPLQFVWLENFITLLSHPRFWQFLGNTFFLMLGLPFAVAGSLAAALLLSRVGKAQHRFKSAMIVSAVVMAVSTFMLLRGGMSEGGLWFLFGTMAATSLVVGVASGGTLYRTLFYLPNFTAGVATFVLWKKMYHPTLGPINQGLQPVLEGLSSWVRDMPGLFALGLPLLACVMALLIAAWQVRRLKHAWSESDAGMIAVTAGLLTLAVPVGLLLWWLGYAAPTAGLAVVAAVFVPGIWIRRHAQPWGRPKAMDKGLGTEVALALLLVPLLLLLAAVMVVGPGLPVAATAGLEPPNWLGDFHWAKPSLMIMVLWAAIGSNNMILYLAGLSSISPELYEAADMDGATSSQRFWHITWPQLAPVTFFICIMSVIHGLQGGFEMARTMTQGGPAGSTTTLSYFIFSEGFQTGRLGYASAVAWVLFALVFGISLLNFRYGNRHVDD